MFTGIISDIGAVRVVEALSAGVRLRIAAGYAPESIELGASISCAGVCLTVVAKSFKDGEACFDVDVSPETLAVTTAAGWRPGTRLNLERALRLGEELGGHLVTGHVDGVAEILDRQADGGMSRFRFRLPLSHAKFVAAKGSIALDGTSLTVNEVERDTFSVMLIPHTLDVTTWGAAEPGTLVNFEVDLMARYAARLLT